VRPLLIAIFSWVAEQGADRRADQGGARARPSPRVRLGRPIRRVNVRLARELKALGASVRAIAKRLKVSPTTLHRDRKGVGGDGGVSA
jgi:DNA invertase Pin-like site-specific DNA recombinase